MSDVPLIELVAHAADRLGDLRNEVVFLGGAVVGLLITDRAARAPRSTRDVDVVVEVGSRVDYYRLDERLRSMGFANDIRGPVCRYLHGSHMIDVMPTHPEILGFANRWYSLAVRTAQPYTLENGLTINLITAPCFLGTKMEAFDDPNREEHQDIFTSRDFGDAVRVIDGRATIVDEVLASSKQLRDYLQERFARILRERYLYEAIAEHVEEGREGLVINRINSFVA